MFIFVIFKNFIQKIKHCKYQKELLKLLQPGDLVWCKMPLSRKELNRVEKSHQIRPYLVVYKD